MSYTCYLDGVEWPTPEKLTVKIKGQNETITLLNEGEINFLRVPGLTEIVVPFTLPMLSAARSPEYYLGILEKLKTDKRTTRFIMVRRSPNGRSLYDTNMKVSVEDYNIVEEAKAELYRAQAEKIRAEGEAEYMRILSGAYNDEGKADYYNYIRSLDALKASLKGDNKTIILDENSELAKILRGNY